MDEVLADRSEERLGKSPAAVAAHDHQLGLPREIGQPLRGADVPKDLHHVGVRILAGHRLDQLVHPTALLGLQHIQQLPVHVSLAAEITHVFARHAAEWDTLRSLHTSDGPVEAALGKRAKVDVFGTDFDTSDGTGVRDYIHVSDLAQAHVLALEALIADPRRSLTMNCGYGRGYSVLEVLDAVDRVTNRTIVRMLGPRRAGDPDSLISDNARIKATLPWVPKFADLDTIVNHALAWERKLSEIRGNG